MSKLATYRKTVNHLGVAGFARRGWARRFGKETSELVSKYSDHPIQARGGSSDFQVFDQIFLDREYRCLDGLRGVRTIIDAGANVGYSSAYLLSQFPDARVIAIEPDPGNFSMLQRNLKPFGDRAITLQAALWSEPTTLDFRDETAEAWAFEVGEAGADGGNVQAIDMPHLVQTYGLTRIDLLKIDIEGAEEAVFSAQELGWLDIVDNIVIELHGDERRDIFMRAIAHRGYALSECDELTVCLSPR